MLPDLLAPNLKLVICGSAAEQKSNLLWETLFAIGLTPRELKPEESEQLLEFGIGLTELGGNELRRKIREYQPGMLVFNGKRPAKEYFNSPELAYGLRKDVIGKTKLFVAPSTSAAAKSSWDPRYWQIMAKLL